ncbi:hypothetical protein A8135_07420 [Legionella jamestowniensis]|uniref:Orphan protein n=1 Tax=Legionella jamestowniensis TaxID=455 RepID=A0ABX2XY59_9GAMM|nr:hypothetical protein [Legionella jamestowniensis]OCH99501.1 hypothetical protein A8135_07420 [Legionella jamestowniensis]
MKIETLQIAIQALNRVLSHPDKGLGQKLLDLLNDDQFEAQKSAFFLKKDILAMLNEFWSSVPAHILLSDDLSSAQYSRLKPWLDFQETLIHAGWDDADHPQRFQQLAAKFSVKDPLLNVSALLGLLKYATRMLGYLDEKKSENEIAQYPFGKLSTVIEARKHLAHEKTKQQRIVTTLALVFYLLHHHCMAEQLELLPLLCEYRLSTTKEERLSEKAALRYMLERILCSQAFFLDYKDFITLSRDWVEDENIITLAPLLPNNISELKKNLDILPWNKILLRGSQSENKKEALIIGANRLFNDFIALKEHSYLDAESLTSTIKLQKVKSPQEKAFINTLLHIFSLQVYENERKKDPRPNSFFAFSGKTKCNAALKKIEYLTGETDHFSFFESLALKQGRLGQLNTSFEHIDIQAERIEIK